MNEVAEPEAQGGAAELPAMEQAGEHAMTGRGKLDIKQYGDNTPVKTGKRAASVVPKGVWRFVKRIKDKAILDKPSANGVKPTHVCIKCWDRLKLTQDKSRDNGL